MIPSIVILGREIPTYGLMILVGVLFVLLYIKLCEPRRDFPPADTELAMTYCVIGVFVGAKLLYLATVWPQFVADLPYLFTEASAFLSLYLSGGFVFYGGFYGALVSAALYCRVTRLDFWELARSLVPVVPLFHVFGRIGCFLTGCCYGIENQRWGIAFSVSAVAPNGVPLLPVQLYEAAGEAILFLLTASAARKKGSGRRVLCLWLIGYGVLRFVLEFFRGDSYRGFVGTLSVSQVLALVSIGLGLWFLLSSAKRKAAGGSAP